MRRRANHLYASAPSCPTNEGRLAIATTAGQGAADASSRKACEEFGGRRSRVVLTPRRWRQLLKKLALLRGDGDNKPGSPRRARSKPLKPSRRECRRYPVNLWWTYSCAFYFCMRGCGCIGRPAFPAPSDLEGPWTTIARANHAARARRCVWKCLRRFSRYARA